VREILRRDYDNTPTGLSGVRYSIPTFVSLFADFDF
jgi:hypothetical protein